MTLNLLYIKTPEGYAKIGGEMTKVGKLQGCGVIAKWRWRSGVTWPWRDARGLRKD